MTSARYHHEHRGDTDSDTYIIVFEDHSYAIQLSKFARYYRKHDSWTGYKLEVRPHNAHERLIARYRLRSRINKLQQAEAVRAAEVMRRTQ